MRVVRVDFAPPAALRVLFSMNRAHWLMLGLSTAMLMGGIVAMERLPARHAERAAALERLRAPRTPPSANRANPAITEEQAAAVNGAIEQINLPWEKLLTAIERATPASVAMLELMPDAGKHRLRGVAETDAPENMLTYIKRLKREPLFANAFLTRHEVNTENPLHPVRFEFEAQWQDAP
jgi:hypothetical protein